MRLCTHLFLFIPSILFSQSFIIDDCSHASFWKSFQSAGVEVVHQNEEKSLRFDVNFTKGSGYGGVFRNFNLPLPANYRISFMMKATVPVNNFEIKASNDSLGETIWWINNKNYSYPKEWKRVDIKKRHLTFAWGPHSAPSPDTLKRLEIVVTAGTGGRGSVWIKDLELIPLPLAPDPLPEPEVTASSFNAAAQSLLKGKPSRWKSAGSKNENITIDFLYPKEFGAVLLEWDKTLHGMNYDILGSLTGKEFDLLYSVRGGKGGDALHFIPEAQARYLRIAMKSNAGNSPFILRGITAVRSEWVASPNQYYELLAARSRAGNYPRYFLKQQSYWTVTGVPFDVKEALFSEDGSFETDKQKLSVEPFIRTGDGQLLTWANGELSQSLADNYLPLPTVMRKYDGVSLGITLLARGETGRAAIMARYLLKNISPKRQRGNFFLALRPFQVNPSSQWLNFEGGFARTDSISINKNRAIADGRSVIVSGSPERAAAAAIDKGDIVEYIEKGKLPSSASAINNAGMTSAAFQFSYDLQQGDSLIVIAASPFSAAGNIWSEALPTEKQFQEEFRQQRNYWISLLNTVAFSLPSEAQQYVDIFKSNLAYILINKDKDGFQPGSRSYERSWIRDGSMTSDALLKFGIQDEPRKFIEWYSSYQYENGMVPCVVDTRGPDPVPENDSHGELIFACMEYFRFTNDTSFLLSQWNTIKKAADYIQHLRGLRMTDEFRSAQDEKKSFYGLVTESISHEGYSDKPRHSYWDNFFALKGIKDAAAAARVLGKKNDARKYDSIATAYRCDLYESMTLSMRTHDVRYIPGCAELGDFDPTSTSISCYPSGEMNYLPPGALNYTFDKYYEWFTQRMKGEIPWEVYTPYEIRSVGTYVFLGQKERAHTLLDWFRRDQRPQGWNHWAEVVDREPRRARFIGDMPHTWVGSDYINAFRSMFVYEDDDAGTLVLGAGLKESWVREGLSVDGLPTHYGLLSYSIKPFADGKVSLFITGTINAAGHPLLIPISILPIPLKTASINDKSVPLTGSFITVEQLPAVVQLEY